MSHGNTEEGLTFGIYIQQYAGFHSRPESRVHVCSTLKIGDAHLTQWLRFSGMNFELSNHQLTCPPATRISADNVSLPIDYGLYGNLCKY